MSTKKPTQHLIELNLQSKYQQLLKVEFIHEYFALGKLKNFEIVPDRLTQIRLKQYQLKAIVEGSTLLIGFGETGPTGSPLKSLKEPMKLSFLLSIQDTDFLNYTELPYEFGDFIYHLTNRTEDKLDEESMSLSADYYVRKLDRLPLSGPMFEYRFQEPQSDDIELTVRNQEGQIVFDKQLHSGQQSCFIQLTDEPAGKYCLELDGLEEMSFYMSPDSPKKVFACIDFYFDPKENGAYALLEEGQPVVKKDFFVRFQSRSVFWKYIFHEMNPAITQHMDFDLYCINNAVAPVFEGPDIFLEDQGSKQLVFTSVEAIPFQENQSLRYKLKTLKGRNQVESILDLPIPSAKGILKKENNGNHDFISEILLYL